MQQLRRFGSLLVVVLLAASMAACSGGAAGPSATTQVQTTLTDFDIQLSPSEVPAGEVDFQIANQGATLHEVEIFRLPAGVDAASLPISNNIADDSAAGLTLVDEVESITPSSTPNLSVALEAGRYAVICNLPSHYGLGMHATLVVN